MALEAAILLVVANLGLEGTQVFYNTFLGEMASHKNIGRISGCGWAAGCVGGPPRQRTVVCCSARVFRARAMLQLLWLSRNFSERHSC